MKPPNYPDVLAEVLIPAEKLQARITELAAEIDRDYRDRDLLLICILRGGVMFLTDLMRRLTVPHAIDFMALASYGSGARSSSGQVRMWACVRAVASASATSAGFGNSASR